MEYPYYVIPDIEALPEAKGEDRKRLIRNIALLVGDPLALREVLGIDPEEFAAFYPDMTRQELSTDDTIDTFIDKFGDKKAAESQEIQDLEALVPLPPADYDLSQIESAPIIVDEEQEANEEGEEMKETGSERKGDATSSLLDSFLKPETPVLSESLARAMIKKGNYSKALEIITELSLKNPKKSIYFADQIRFLKKLILNQSASKKQ